jgi:hypothetical protein
MQNNGYQEPAISIFQDALAKPWHTKREKKQNLTKILPSTRHNHQGPLLLKTLLADMFHHKGSKDASAIVQHFCKI